VRDTKVIALWSLRGASGKDTLFSLMKLHGFSVARVAFADSLKEEVAGLMPYSFRGEDDKDTDFLHLAIDRLTISDYQRFALLNYDPSTSRSYRWHLQKYGTEYVRDYLELPTYWMDRGLAKIEALMGTVDYILVTDMRLLNEYERLSEFATTVCMVRDWCVLLVDSKPFHKSDVELLKEKFDITLINTAGKPHLLVSSLLEQLNERK
jgi:hypothetical protein